MKIFSTITIAFLALATSVLAVPRKNALPVDRKLTARTPVPVYVEGECYTDSCESCMQLQQMEECASEPYAIGGCGDNSAYTSKSKGPFYQSTEADVLNRSCLRGGQLLLR